MSEPRSTRALKSFRIPDTVRKRNSMYTKLFSAISKQDALIAGGKGASLGEMTNAGVPVPPGFVVLADAFEEKITQRGMEI